MVGGEFQRHARRVSDVSAVHPRVAGQYHVHQEADGPPLRRAVWPCAHRLLIRHCAAANDRGYASPTAGRARTYVGEAVDDLRGRLSSRSLTCNAVRRR